VSSFQLESAVEFAPHIAVWLNLAENHLERHGDMRGYLEAKSRIFTGQGAGDWAILNAGDAYFSSMLPFVRAGVVRFGIASAGGGEDGGSFYSPSGRLLFSSLPVGQETYSFERCRLLGRHNKLNIAAAVAAARLAGAKPPGCREVIESFAGIEHRLELVVEQGGVTYINDSKSTTVAATIAAVEAMDDEFPGRPFILLVGGQAKHGSWEPLQRLLPATCKEVICFGADGRKILMHLTEGAVAPPGAPAFSICAGVDEAVRQARARGKRGDIVLLSPGCASYDAYPNYTKRGEHFKELVVRA
jgi:UDP-N-acetylmuramoylalanine--D-glutamate ligase